MKTTLIFLLLLCVPAIANCQGNRSLDLGKVGTNFDVITQQEPFFPGGDKNLFDYFMNNIQYSDEDVAKNLKGSVMVSFDVMPDSTLTNIALLSGIDKRIDDEILQLVKSLKYAPGVENGTVTKMNVIISVAVRAE